MCGQATAVIYVLTIYGVASVLWPEGGSGELVASQSDIRKIDDYFMTLRLGYWADWRQTYSERSKQKTPPSSPTPSTTRTISMKFCHQLDEERRLSPVEWAPFFLNYKLLKVHKQCSYRWPQCLNCGQLFALFSYFSFYLVFLPQKP